MSAIGFAEDAPGTFAIGPREHCSGSNLLKAGAGFHEHQHPGLSPRISHCGGGTKGPSPVKAFWDNRTHPCPECEKEWICPNCGVRLKEVAINWRSPIIAALVSVVICGQGQIYNGVSGIGIASIGIASIIIGMLCAASILNVIGFIQVPGSGGSSELPMRTCLQRN